MLLIELSIVHDTLKRKKQVGLFIYRDHNPYAYIIVVWHFLSFISLLSSYCVVNFLNRDYSYNLTTWTRGSSVPQTNFKSYLLINYHERVF